MSFDETIFICSLGRSKVVDDIVQATRKEKAPQKRWLNRMEIDVFATIAIRDV